jgi:N-acetylneuraminate synthase
VYTKEELDKYRESPWGTTNREQKMGLEFSKEEYREIDKYCREKGIGWFASPWDVKSVDFLKEFDVPYIKIASASITDEALLDAVNKTGIPVILSTGMSTKKEIDLALSKLDKVEYILSCVSTYPTQPKDVNMEKLLTIQGEYGDKYKIGYSNHSPGIVFMVVATALGAEMLEYHITLDRSMYGSDQAASIETSGVLKMGKYISAIDEGWGSGEISCSGAEEQVKEKLRKNG